MKTLTRYPILQDERGTGKSGKTMVAYPAGTAIHGTTASDEGYGRYKFLLDPTSDNLIISRLYDIYVNGVIYQKDMDLGLWEWYVSNVEVDAEQTFNFADLTDENGEVLPTTIEEAEIKLIPQRDRGGYISAQSDTDFTITLYSTGGADKGLFDVHIVVKT